MKRAAILAAAIAACSPPAELVEYQQRHEAEWIPPGGLPLSLHDLSEDQLLHGMGRAVSSHSAFVGGTVFVHYEFCRTRRFFREHGEDREFQWWDGAWHPVRWFQGCEPGDAIRVMTANGRVASGD